MVMTAASSVGPWAPRPAAVHAVTAGLRLYSDVFVPADECAFGEVRNAALRDAAFRDELQDNRGLPSAPRGVPMEYSAPN